YMNPYPYPATMINRPFNPYQVQKTVAQANATIGSKINEYIAKALYYIDYIIRMIQSSSPYIERMQPILEDLPTMYQLVKAFQEISQEQKEKEIEREPIEYPDGL